MCGESSCVGSGEERLLTGVVRARRRGLTTTRAGHSGEYAMREKILRKLM